MAKAKADSKTPDMIDKDLVSVQDRIRSRLANIDSSTQQVSGQNISCKGKVFRLPTGQTSPGPMNCIIVDYINKNMWYKDQYVEGEFAEPDCFAVGRDIASMVPAETVKEPIHAMCDSCPKNKFGTKGRGKECGNNVLLAVLSEDFSADTELYAIKVSPTALSEWTKYVRSLAIAQVDPSQVITSLSFEEKLGYPSLRFKQLGPNTKVDELSAFIPKADILLTAE